MEIHQELTLEKRIRAELYGYDGTMGIYIDDLKGTVIAMNQQELYETASCCKMFILAALFHKIEKGGAALTDMLTLSPAYVINGSGVLSALELGSRLSVANTASLMIIVSDNIATNMLIDYLGLDYINGVIEELGLRHSRLHNPIDFEKYAKLGTTTPADYASLWVRMAKRELISQRASEEMLAICRKQQYHSMLTGKFPCYYMDEDNYGAAENQLLWVASKSGSMNACRNDGGIIHTPYGEYVIVLLNKAFSDISYHNDHPAYTYGSAVSRLVLDQYLALCGHL